MNPRLLRGLALAPALLLLACGPSASDDAPAPTPAESASRPSAAEQWDRMARTEQLVQGLDEKLRAMAFAVRNFELPDRATRNQFAPVGLKVEDIAGDGAKPKPVSAIERLGVEIVKLPPAPSKEGVFPPDLALWEPLFAQVAFFEHVKLQIERAHFVEGSEPEEFLADLLFSAHARTPTGQPAYFGGSPKVRWRRLAGDAEDPDSWRIVSWETGPIKRLTAPRPLFREVVNDAILEPDERSLARVDLHERQVAKKLLARKAGEPFEEPYPHFFAPSVSRHPGLAVVDLDGDGFDDVYVLTRWGRNHFFHNRGDGGFDEIASEVGLDIDGFSNAGLFADFDNDGDPDLFIGNSMEPSRYLENEDGRFVDRTEERIDGPPPALVSSLSAVDVDGDGLLDLYAAVYGAQLPLDEIRRHLPPHVYEEFMRRGGGDVADFVDATGPPNVLLMNRGGGRFEVVRDAGALAVYRHTYQATWADFDDDGDPDVYLANDFGPDTMVRNDGDGVFVDVTAERGFDQVGFGMSASFGDYDRDGREDLYVANMFSKAGNRVTRGLDYLDGRFFEAAQGNYLFRNESDRFRLVSGAGEGEIPVHRAGWSWGSQFFDADNDGFLDLYSLAGFFTAPPEVAKAGDT